MVNSVQSFIQHFISSVGLKRKLTSLFQVLAVTIGTIPSLTIYASLLQKIASYLGISAVVHAGAAGTTGGSKFLSTVAAFFSALVLAAQTTPSLQPYTVTIQAIAAVLGLFVHVNVKAK